jgi:hypothetical protein
MGAIAHMRDGVWERVRVRGNYRHDTPHQEKLRVQQGLNPSFSILSHKGRGKAGRVFEKLKTTSKSKTDNNKRRRT